MTTENLSLPIRRVDEHVRGIVVRKRKVTVVPFVSRLLYWTQLFLHATCIVPRVLNRLGSYCWVFFRSTMKFTTNWSSSSNPRNGGNSKAPRVQIVRRPEDALHDMRDMRTLPSVSSLVEPKTARFDSMMDGRTVPPSNSLPSPPPSNEPSVDSSTRSSFDLPLQQLSPRVHPSPLKLAARSSDHPLPPPPSSENTPTFSVQPPFEPLLMSAPPSCPVDPAKTIVTLETCTDTYRTTLQTLTARPSHLANFLLSLLVSASETSSVYSGTSDPPPPAEKGPPNALLQGSLSSLRGQTHQSVPVIHIFLDRASAPCVSPLTPIRYNPD